MKTKYILLTVLLLLVYNNMAVSQELSPISFLKLPLEEQVKTYFDTFRDGHTHIPVSRFAGYIVYSHGPAVIPYLKEYLKDADFFSTCKNPPIEDSNPNFYEGEPNDITLTLIACVWAALHRYSNWAFRDTMEPYTLDDGVIQWFVDEYKRRIDEYILATKMIDETVKVSETLITWVAIFGTGNDIREYGHPYFNKPVNRRGNDLKLYYEERLGIPDLQVVPPFLE
jgi:hypothetical protein